MSCARTRPAFNCSKPVALPRAELAETLKSLSVTAQAAACPEDPRPRYIWLRYTQPKLWGRVACSTYLACRAVITSYRRFERKL